MEVCVRNKVVFRFSYGVSSMISSAFHNCFKPEDKSKKIDTEDRKLTAEELEQQRIEEAKERVKQEEIEKKALQQELGLIVVNGTEDDSGGSDASSDISDESGSYVVVSPVVGVAKESNHY